MVCKLEVRHGQRVMEYRPVDQVSPGSRNHSAFLANQRRRRRTTRDPRAVATANSDLWHLRMGHIGQWALHKLGKHVHEVHIDWTDLKTEYRGFLRVMFITCRWTGIVFPYFMSTHGSEQENLQVVKDFVQWCDRRYNLKVKVVRSDNELNRGRTKAWIRDQGISFEASAPNTYDQNGRAERSGGVVMEKARAMRISAKLPHDMWMESVNTAVYLYNRTPRHANKWETPYERFYTFLDQ